MQRLTQAEADANEPACARAASTVLDRRLDPDSRAPIAVALSGGGDSVALLRLTVVWARAHGRPVLALTVDHGLHRASAEWTADSGELAGALGCDWRPLRWEVSKPATGLPAAARQARHALLAEAARDAGARAILTGHTADDVLEGELMRAADAPTLGRLREWSPSPAWPDGRGVFLLRPLLGVRRAELRAWLTAQGASWIDDPANSDPRYARARARARLASGGELLAPDGGLTLPSATSDAARFSAALLCAAGTTRPPRAEQLARLLDRLKAGERFTANLAGARIEKGGGEALITREPGERGRGGLAPLALPLGKPVIWDGRFELIADGHGLSVAPLAGLAARLPPAERAALAAVPPAARAALPAIVDGAGDVRLPRPYGAAPVEARCLVLDRFDGAIGLIPDERALAERTLAPAPHGAASTLTLS